MLLVAVAASSLGHPHDRITPKYKEIEMMIDYLKKEDK